MNPFNLGWSEQDFHFGFRTLINKNPTNDRFDLLPAFDALAIVNPSETPSLVDVPFDIPIRVAFDGGEVSRGVMAFPSEGTPNGELTGAVFSLSVHNHDPFPNQPEFGVYAKAADGELDVSDSVLGQLVGQQAITDNDRIYIELDHVALQQHLGGDHLGIAISTPSP